MSISISGSGAITGASTSYSFDQAVSIAGTVTYEDVTNVDSVGIITANAGIDISNTIVSNNDSTIRYDNDTLHVKVDANNVRGSSTFKLDVDDTNAITIDENRRIGIGTDNPSSTLQVGLNPNNGTGAGVAAGSNGALKVARAADADQVIEGYKVGDSSPNFVVRADGRTGIGTDSPTRPLHLDNASQASFLISGTAPQIRFNSSTSDSTDADRVILARSGAGDQFISGSADGDAILRCATSKKVMIGYGTTEIAQFNSSGLKFKSSGMGIDFSETGDGSGTMTSELLDDYEEGTFTPTLTFSTPGTSSFSYSVNAGHYTKVGNMIYYRMEIRLSAFSKGTASGDLRVNGLPYTAANLSNGQFVGSLATFNTPMSTDAGDYMIFAASQNAATGFFKTVRSNNSWIAVPDPDSNSQYKISVTVLTA